MTNAETSTTNDAAAMPAKAEFLCFCSRVKAEQFFEAAASAESPDFNSLCMRTNVGIHCTACVLDAERVFHQALSGKAEAATAGNIAHGGTKTAGRPSLLNRLASLFPSVPNNFRSVAPIFGGQGIATVLSINNGSLASIDAKLVPMRARIDSIAPDGRRIGRKDVTVAPDSKFEIELSRSFAPPAEPFALLGSARVRLRARGIGHVGIVRPHFRIESAVASASVHTVDSGDTESFHYFSNSPETSSAVVVISGTERESRHTVSVKRLDESTVFELRGELAGYGSAMYALPTESSGSFLVHVAGSRLQRSFFVARDRDTISVDHI